MKPAIAATTLLLALSLNACGGEDEPAVCNSSADLKVIRSPTRRRSISAPALLSLT